MGSINLGIDFESILKDRVFFRVLARHWPAKIVIFTWEEVEEAELWLEAQNPLQRNRGRHEGDFRRSRFGRQ